MIPHDWVRSTSSASPDGYAYRRRDGVTLEVATFESGIWYRVLLQDGSRLRGRAKLADGQHQFRAFRSAASAMRAANVDVPIGRSR